MKYSLTMDRKGDFQLHKFDCRASVKLINETSNESYTIDSIDPISALKSFFTDEGTEGNIEVTKIHNCCN